MVLKAKRDQVVALKAAGVSTKNIIKQLNVCRKTVFNTWKRFTKSVTAATSQPIPGRKQTIRTV